MRTTFFLLSICLLKVCHLFAQTTTPNWAELDSLFRYGNFQRVLDVTNQVVAQPADSTQLIEALWRRGAVLIQQQEIQNAFFTLGRAYQISEHCHCVGSKTQVSVNYWNGLINVYVGFLDQAELMFGRCLTIQKSNVDASAAEKSLVHRGLSVLLYFRGQTKESIKQAREALTLLNPSNPIDSLQNLDRIAACYNLIGNNLATSRDSTAINYFLPALQMCEAFYGKPENLQSGKIQYSIGRSLIETGKFGADTEIAFEEAIRHFASQKGTEIQPAVASAYSYIGICRYAQRDFEDALQRAEMALAIGKQTLPSKHNDLAAYQKEIAQCLEALGRNEEAAVQYKSALKIFKDSNTYPYLSGAFEVLASCTRLNETLYRNSLENRFLDSALMYGNAAKTIFYSIRNSFSATPSPQGGPSSILEFADRAYPSLEHVIRIFLLADSVFPGQYYGDEAYNLAERFQGYILLKSRFLSGSGPSTLTGAEPEHLTLNQVRIELLKPGQVLLQYFVGGFHVYLFIIRRDTFTVRKIPLNFPLETWCNEFRQGITDYHKFDLDSPERNTIREKRCNALYLRTARDLYRHLFAPAEPFIRSGEEIIIIPDDKLATIPFEALLTDDPDTNLAKPQFDLLPYLLRQHPMRYGWSATTLKEMSTLRSRSQTCQKPLDFLGFAPFYKNNWLINGESQEVLEWSGHTVSDIIPLFGNKGGGYLGGKAQKSVFLKEIFCSKFLHLGTHASADGREGYIAFAPSGGSKQSELLSLSEIYGLKVLQSEVITLGACETGNGRFAKGEGVLSFGRAFAYAGAKSIVFTLWAVKEASARQVTVVFYKEMITGKKSKSEALAAAKRKMLGPWSSIEAQKLKEEGINVKDMAHPYYWAGFVLAGDGGIVKQ